MSAEQVGVIISVMAELPRWVSESERERAVEILTTLAEQAPPRAVAQAGRRLIESLDPDGRTPREDELDRRRQLSLRPRADGSWHLEGDLTPTCGEQLWAFLAPRSAPRPTDDSGRDERSAGQRRHDALAEAAAILARHRGPADSGAPATVIVTMTAGQLRAGGADHAAIERRNRAEGSCDERSWSASGESISARTAHELADEAEILTVLADRRRVPLDLGRTRRLASRSQTLALVARDRGCSFPGCDAPPTWCQRHHVRAWRHGGRTDLGNLTLLCHYHHREFERRGWACRMIGGFPGWIPPAWIDPERRPRFNVRIRR